MRRSMYYCKVGLVLITVILAGSITSCKNDDITDDSYYTFTGAMLGQYLEENPNEYSEFSKMVKRCVLKNEVSSSLDALLNAYGSFTCFAPDNEAVEKYLKRYGMTSVDQMTDSAISVICRMHLVNSSLKNVVYESKNFATKLPDQNMYNKTIYLSPEGTTYRVNEMAVVEEKDILVQNGVVHRIDSVLEPSDMQLGTFLESYPEYSLFNEAVNETNVATRLNTEPEDLYFTPATQFTDIGGGTAVITPQYRFFYYTCFLETNEVFANAGIHSLDDMKEYAKKWFEDAYANETKILQAGLTNQWTDSLNYFNRFVSYHFVNKMIDRSDFTYYRTGVATAYEKFQEYTETIAPNQLLFMAAGKNCAESDEYADALQLNPSADQVLIPGMGEAIGWSRPQKNGVLLATTPTRYSSNGIFHELQGVLTFNRTDFKKTRFRYDYASLFPELMSNAIRAKFTNGQQVYFKNGYLSNIWFRSEGTRLYYLNPQHGAGAGQWCNYEGDEMMAKGNFDFDIRLPAVPAGQYEVRFGYTANGNRGCAQIYMGTSRDNMQPCGIPVDLTQSGSRYGWIADTGGTEDYESDKLLHANGWMKGPNSVFNANGRESTTLRQNQWVIRCVVGVVNLQEDGNIYIRFRNATTNEQAEFMMDYLEVCPVAIYDNPNQPEPRD